MKKVRKESLERQGKLQSKCPLFVYNKWDLVPEKETEEVKNHVTRTLERFWPGLDPDLQIIYMSTTKATKAQNYGFITEEFSSLINAVKSTVLNSIEASLEFHSK